MTDLTLDEFKLILAQRAVEAGGPTALAKQIGVSYAFLYDVIHGAKKPGTKVLNFMQYSRIDTPATYRPRHWPPETF